jgi:hypothetical protein
VCPIIASQLQPGVRVAVGACSVAHLGREHRHQAVACICQLVCLCGVLQECRAGGAFLGLAGCCQKHNCLLDSRVHGVPCFCRHSFAVLS